METLLKTILWTVFAISVSLFIIGLIMFLGDRPHGWLVLQMSLGTGAFPFVAAILVKIIEG